MHIAFENKELMEVAYGTTTLDAAPDKLDAWKKKNSVAKWLITIAMTLNIIDMIVNCKTTADM